jgi:hypothetical protein
MNWGSLAFRLKVKPSAWMRSPMKQMQKNKKDDEEQK